jgi:hypothetical protein
MTESQSVYVRGQPRKNVPKKVEKLKLAKPLLNRTKPHLNPRETLKNALFVG